MSGSSPAVRFLYATAPGRVTLKLIGALRADRLAVRYLCSRASRPFLVRYARRNGVEMSRRELRQFRTFRDFFARERGQTEIDRVPEHLISPCDGWLSAYPLTADSVFAIKGSHYRVRDLLEDETLAKNYEGGVCLVFRLCASDYHRYCYIDDGRQGANHRIDGQLHSVQPIACENVPVFTLNRRCWCLMETEHFGPVVQTEIGALVVGGIVNHAENARITRGGEKGRFELAGSTIVLLFEPERIRLLPAFAKGFGEGRETRVEQGMQIGSVYGS